MFEVNKTDRINELISITKSDSGISGPELAMAHMELGKHLAQSFPEMKPEDTTVVAMLRGGIFFAEGIYFAQKMQYQLDYWKLLSVLIIMTFLFHPAVWLICLIWNIVDIVKNNKCESENAAKESMRLWWQLLLTIIYMVVFLVTSFRPIFGIGC